LFSENPVSFSFLRKVRMVGKGGRKIKLTAVTSGGLGGCTAEGQTFEAAKLDCFATFGGSLPPVPKKGAAVTAEAARTAAATTALRNNILIKLMDNKFSRETDRRG
jgi:hypothetical protein